MSKNSSWDLGLSIGESFAEFSAFAPSASGSGAEAAHHARWYLPRKSLTDGLKEALRALDSADGGHLRIASDAVARILHKRQGRAPAVLVSAGFETWLETQQPVTSAPFSARTERSRLPTERELLFSVGGRMAPDGTELEALSTADLDALAAKLTAAKVKDVALNFHLADQNPEHERQAASYLRDQGFRVFASHMFGTDHGVAGAWRAAIECAFAESAVLEEKEQIEAALKDTAWTAEVVTGTGVEPLERWSAANSREGLKRIFREQAKTPTLHCGLDLFCLFGTDADELLPARITSVIRHAAWSFPTIDGHTSTGFAPGPMALGKSQKLTLFDVLFVRERLRDIEGLTPLLSEKTRPRILESLFTMAKQTGVGSANARPPDASQIAADLEREFIERCAIDLGAAGVEKRLALTGPLAETVKLLLSTRRPDIQFSFVAANAWAESEGLARAARGVEAQA